MMKNANMQATARKKTDAPTMLMHWGFVGAIMVSIATGWRISSLQEGIYLFKWLDIFILQGNVLRWHFISSSVLVSLVSGYIIFLWKMGFFSRFNISVSSLINPDRGIRWQSINRLIYWFVLVLLFGAAVTGGLVYFLPGTLPISPLIKIHRWLSWCFVLYVVIHVFAQVFWGGWNQILKIINPRLAYGVGAVFAIMGGAGGALAFYAADHSAKLSLYIAKTTELPILDGKHDDLIWKKSEPVIVHTGHGFNFGGSGETPVYIQAVHDGNKAYFLFRWKDATRSQKHIPLQKTAEGWKLLQKNYYSNDENDYYEDKFAVMIARSPIAGGNTVHLGAKPFADKPGPSNGLGLHASLDGSLVDMWHWKSVRSGALNQFDDNYFGPLMDVSTGRYTGGYTQDPKTKGGFDQNFTKIPNSPFVQLKYLPKNLAHQQALMGSFNLDTEASDFGQYAMALTDVQPYSAEADAAIAVGTVIPSVVYDIPFEGDRGDVSAHAEWKDGWWTLEASRLLDTGSKFDQPIADGNYMWVSVFDHSQVRHTRHILPMKIVIK
jgi:Ethylbenzene dehydrogenase/Prokaryotic cytochrome b561